MTKNLYLFFLSFHFFKSYLNVVLKIDDELNLWCVRFSESVAIYSELE